jgi:hypothetical protein
VAPEFGVWDGDTFIPTPGRPTLARPSQDKIKDRQIAVQEAKNAGKTGAAGRGPGSGMTSAQLDWRNFQDWKKVEGNENGTIVDYKAAMVRAGRPDSVTESNQPSRNQKTTTKKYVWPSKPGKPGSLDDAVEKIGSYRGDMPAPAGEATYNSPPGGQTGLTPIGKTTDGRIIYRDAKGNTGTKD